MRNLCGCLVRCLFRKCIPVLLSGWCFLCITGCTGCVVEPYSPFRDDKLVVLTWNAQLFFDAVEDGYEFPEFRGKNSRWTADLYRQRLERMREVILLAGAAAGRGPERGPDVIVLQEIESESVMEDIRSFLPESCGYNHIAFASPRNAGFPDSALGTGILSRHPFLSVLLHTVDSPVSLRPMIEAAVATPQGPVVLLAVHWKSKAGSDTSDDTDRQLRNLQLALLSGRFAVLKAERPGVPVIAAGDFNQTLEEFDDAIPLFSVWPWWLERCRVSLEPGPEGSYLYAGRWEAIDHFFLEDSLFDGRDLDFLSFRVLSRPPLTTGAGKPASFELYTGRGYSDHLPLLLELQRIH